MSQSLGNFGKSLRKTSLRKRKRRRRKMMEAKKAKNDHEPINLNNQ